MPTYVFACPAHGEFDDFRPISKFTRATKCPDCGARSTLVLSNTQKHRITFEAGYNDSAGKYFYTKKERDNWLRENGSVLV